jgi:hypothetical protein
MHFDPGCEDVKLTWTFPQGCKLSQKHEGSLHQETVSYFVAFELEFPEEPNLAKNTKATLIVFPTTHRNLVVVFFQKRELGQKHEALFVFLRS